MPLPFIISFLVGGVLFACMYFLNKKFAFRFISFVYFALGVIAFLFIMLFTRDPNNVYAGIGYIILLLMSSLALAGYLVSWFVIKKVARK